jgi:hypothetical protein
MSKVPAGIFTDLSTISFLIFIEKESLETQEGNNGKSFNGS